jgi:hypothetical protein
MPSHAKCANPLFASVSALARIRSDSNVARSAFQPCNNALQQCPYFPDSNIRAMPRHAPCLAPWIPSRQQTCPEKSDVKQGPCRLFSALQASPMPCHPLAQDLPYCTLERHPASKPLAHSLQYSAVTPSAMHRTIYIVPSRVLPWTTSHAHKGNPHHALTAP